MKHHNIIAHLKMNIYITLAVYIAIITLWTAAMSTMYEYMVIDNKEQVHLQENSNYTE